MITYNLTNCHSNFLSPILTHIFNKGEEVPLISETIPHEVSGDSGEFSGTEGISGVSGEPSGDRDISGASGTLASGVVPEVTLVPDVKGQYLT